MADRAALPLGHELEEPYADLFATLPVYEMVTGAIRVQVQVFWLAEQSEPDEGSYCWAYRIRIANDSAHPVQLIERTWHITDTQGREDHVQGAGVVGEQPIIQPGTKFEYTSGAALGTPGGFMRGTYLMRDTTTGTCFDVTIPAFSLDSPFQKALLH